MQTLVVIVVVAAAVLYAGWRVFRLLHRHDNYCCGCTGCPLRDKCSDCEGNKSNQ
ncbi:MAG: hypothetical protein IJP74_09725 [Prevotella sp.]|nr:hypothetical protein [Prevotella sp.]